MGNWYILDISRWDLTKNVMGGKKDIKSFSCYHRLRAEAEGY